MSPEGLQEIQNQIEKNIRCDIFYSLWLWAELDIQEASNSNWHLQREKTVGKSLLFFVCIYVINVIFRRTSAIALFNAWKILKKSRR